MESITKNRQPEEILRAMLARAYGQAEAPEDSGFAVEEGHGWFNVVYRARLRGGRQVALKIAPPPGVTVMTYERDMMRNEIAAMRLIEANTGVPIPHVDHVDTAHDLVDADWFAMPFIEGENFGIVGAGLPPEQRDAINEQLGAHNRALNAIVGPHFGPLGGPGHPTWRAAFGEMIENVLRDGERAGVDLGWPVDDVRAVIGDLLPGLDAVTEPRFVEWDLWDSNVMIRDGRIISILDHERALYGDPLIEAGFTALDLAEFGEPTAFLRGYGRGPLTPDEADRRRLYTLYLLLIMVIETKYRGHAEPTQYDWARHQLAELMGAIGRRP